MFGWVSTVVLADPLYLGGRLAAVYGFYDSVSVGMNGVGWLVMDTDWSFDDGSRNRQCVRGNGRFFLASPRLVVCMLHLSRKWANLWGRREGRVDRRWVDRAVALVVPIRSRTPLPPVGHSEQIQGSRTRICKCGGRQRNDTDKEYTMVAVAGIDVGKDSLEVWVRRRPCETFRQLYRRHQRVGGLAEGARRLGSRV